MNSFKLHKGLIVHIGGLPFELMSDCEAVTAMDAVSIIELGALTMHEKIHVSEINKLSSIVDDFAVAGGEPTVKY